ncbi:LacI family transcriptional regulator [Opitutia bacterium ISCC 51]|nr:LacI family transcriptional regulator [Opitutae bacterium ISCC 51]QXD29550.1 LacI family transcriptional regulator [Opitutae bacterium ISCC 52]
MKPKRPSCKTIAEEAGVSRMTVSMALRDHPRVAEETRKRIKEIALRQGYTPDPNLTELMRYLRKRDISKEEPVIALLNGKPYPVKEFGAEAKLIREGAIKHAEELGFKTEDFWLHEPNMREERMVQILETRGIRGVVVLPVEELKDVFSFPHDDFEGVATCSVAAKLGFNQVHPHFYQAMHVGIANLEEKGFNRIGFCETTAQDERSNHLYHCYLTWYQQGIEETDRIPPLLQESIDKDDLLSWVKENKPEVVYSSNMDHYRWLKEAGMKIPEDIAFAALGPAEEITDDIAHVHIGYRKIGATAIDILKTKLAHESLGPTENPAVTLIRGEWKDGASAQLPNKAAVAS